MEIAALIQARTGSQRCPNKMLREFCNTNLISLALKKFAGTSQLFKLYFAVHEQELIHIGKNYNCNIIKRNEQSAKADDIKTVFNYIDKIEEEYIMFINACSPFLTLKTLENAIDCFKKNKPKSLTAVIKKHTWYYFLDGKPINFLDPTNLNTKSSVPVFEVTHNIHIFNKNRFIEHTYFWNHSENDPYFFEIDEMEAIDIDTEFDFYKAESIYSRMKENS